MSRPDSWLRTAIVVLAFGYLAAMAATGELRSRDNLKSEVLGWVVEDVFVASLGRPGAAFVFLAMGLVAAAIAARWTTRRSEP